jgi:nucleotide-binding universal stress UspA family protein
MLTDAIGLLPRGVNALMEPTLTVTGPDGEKTKNAAVHPNTSFDQDASGVSSPMNSDTEADITDIRRAQKMALTVSPIHSTPEAHRVIRQIIRGQYSLMQREAEQGLRRQRVYLVATDLSEEAAYALEWTIGTVLRDGDTLLAVYAVDEETGTGGESSSVGIGEGASAIQDTASIVGSFPNTLSPDTPATPGPSPLGASDNNSANQPDLSSMSKSERERYHAATEVSDRCVKLLRKTRLQVRVVVEVFHCKSPKHMITEVIDFLEPTLVILGSRGRSALKGVLLGSFSNYLVTKSSIPVMVARKKLKKHNKFKRSHIRFSNVLTNPNTNVTSGARFANAKVDEFAGRPGSEEYERAQRKKNKEEKQLKEALALIPR